MKPVSKVGVGGPVAPARRRWSRSSCRCSSRAASRPASSPTTSSRTRTSASCGAPSTASCRPSRIVGVETGGCPHTAVREDPTANLAAIEELLDALPGHRRRPDRERRRQPDADLQPAARRPQHLRPGRGGRRQDAAQAGARPDERRPARDQQDRPRAVRRRRPRRHGARRERAAHGPARLHRLPHRRRHRTRSPTGSKRRSPARGLVARAALNSLGVRASLEATFSRWRRTARRRLIRRWSCAARSPSRRRSPAVSS